ncbi:Holliday junction resolvase RuvX [Methylohalobius crimeensis]|uniref:Holliday junction resolvase RuvX n=1 Tax=Methylohalobius crimeensis TaxID=244365 RepID=UPI0003B326F9|nr:Holliday junction resolvase RuvX [Methylohalobius crimeensis]
MDKRGTYLGFDYGTHKIGVAVGQRITGTASPLETIRSEKKSVRWEAIDRLVNTWCPDGLIVGIACQPDGQDNPITPLMRKFCRQLEARYQVPVYPVDEHLTSFESRRLLFDEVNLRARKVQEFNDQVAAKLILQTWLNHREHAA